MGCPLHEFFDHTGDIGVRLAGPSMEALFASAVEALSETLTDPATVEPRRAERIALGPAPADLLLADLLSELVFRFETCAFLPHRAAIAVTRDDGDFRLTADVTGDTFDPARHQVRVLVKAVTLHRLQVRQDAAGWQATVVLDV